MSLHLGVKTMTLTVADPDLELRGRGGGSLYFALLALFPSVISSFLPKIGGLGPWALPLDPPLT